MDKDLKPYGWILIVRWAGSVWTDGKPLWMKAHNHKVYYSKEIAEAALKSMIESGWDTPWQFRIVEIFVNQNDFL